MSLHTTAILARAATVTAMMSLLGGFASASEARPSNSDPLQTVRAVIGQVDRLPCWCEGRFFSAVANIATPELIRAVKYGSRIAGQKHIDLYDADFFVGQQNVRRAKVLSGHVTSQTESSATVEARVAVEYADGSVYPPIERTYWLKRVGGTWKVDDLGMGGKPEVKLLFLHPESVE